MTNPTPVQAASAVERAMRRWPQISDKQCQMLVDAGLVECVGSGPYQGGVLSTYRVRTPKGHDYLASLKDTPDAG